MPKPPLLDRPLFIIGCNRSGTTLLFRTLSDHPELWSNYEELQEIFWSAAAVDDDQGERVSTALSAEPARRLERELYGAAHNRERFKDVPGVGALPIGCFRRRLNFLYKRPPIRFVEKTPANSLRIPLLASAFPTARFVFLLRKPEAVISSLMEGWKNWSGVEEGEWSYQRWHYLKPPGWKEQSGRSLQEICAFQWVESNRIAWTDLEAHAPGRYVSIRYEEVLAEPEKSYERILEFAELPNSRYFNARVRTQGQRHYTHGGSAPRKEKWKRLHEAEVESVRHLFQPLAAELDPA